MASPTKNERLASPPSSASSPDLAELVSSLSQRKQQELSRLLSAKRKGSPLPGPQTQALESQADVLLFGGAAGGGKSDLLLGLAHLHHQRSIVFRREYVELRAVVDRSVELLADAGELNRSEMVWRLRDGRQVEFGAVQHAGDEQKFQGRPHDLKGFDEVPSFTEGQFRFLCGWLRSTNPKQRTRVVCTGNPPTTAEGEWVIRYWAPWLDPQHPRPARPGELRWFTTIDGKDAEIESGEPFTHKGEIITPRSRTFIPARVSDNPHLVASGYVAQLQALPEPLRSKMLLGDFTAGREDSPWQVIPREWVCAAQERWRARPASSAPMDALGVDVARGGKDRTVIVARRGNWVGRPWMYPGASTPDGPAVAALALQHREDKAAVHVDVIGVGSSVYDCLRAALGGAVIPMNGAAGTEARDKSGQLGFLNSRAAWYWGLREMLDPKSEQDLALPPDPELLADLTAPTWKLTARGIQVESKDELIKRLGRSPDMGDAVVYACAVQTVEYAGLLDFVDRELRRLNIAVPRRVVEPSAQPGSVPVALKAPPAPAPAELVCMAPPPGAASRYLMLSAVDCASDAIDVPANAVTIEVPTRYVEQLKRLGFTLAQLAVARASTDSLREVSP